MASHILGLNGKKQSGKGTVADSLVENFGYTKMSWADALREAAYGTDPFVQVTASLTAVTGPVVYMRYSEVIDEVGYEAAKRHPDVRRLLQRLGTEGGRDVHGQNCWTKIVMRKAAEIDGPVVIDDVRFLNEAVLVDTLIRVVRPDHEDEGNTEHSSEDFSDFDHLVVHEIVNDYPHAAGLAIAGAKEANNVVGWRCEP